MGANFLVTQIRILLHNTLMHEVRQIIIQHINSGSHFHGVQNIPVNCASTGKVWGSNFTRRLYQIRYSVYCRTTLTANRKCDFMCELEGNPCGLLDPDQSTQPYSTRRRWKFITNFRSVFSISPLPSQLCPKDRLSIEPHICCLSCLRAQAFRGLGHPLVGVVLLHVVNSFLS